MNNVFIKSLLVGIFLFSSLSGELYASVSHGTISVLIENTESNKGQLFIYLFNRADPFPIETKQVFKYKISKIKDGQAKVTFDNVPYGKYAVAVHHDEDGDGKVNTNFIGIPTEDFGASNNAKGFMGPPSFDDASFELSKNSIEVRIDMD